MTNSMDSPRRHAVTDDESVPHQLRAAERYGPFTSSGTTRKVVHVSGSGRLTSATMAELLTMARRAGGRIVVRGGSRRHKRVLVRAGLPIGLGDVGTSPATQLRGPL